MVDRKTDGESVDPTTPAAADLPGEELASHTLADPGDYTVSADETEAEELTDVDESSDESDELEIDDLDQLSDAEEDARDAVDSEPATLAAAVRESRPRLKSAAPAKKGTATPSRGSSSAAADKRTTPAQFVNQSVDELKKVVWPTGVQVRQYFWVVLVFVLFIMLYVVALDTGLGALLLRLLGSA